MSNKKGAAEQSSTLCNNDEEETKDGDTDVATSKSDKLHPIDSSRKSTANNITARKGARDQINFQTFN